jgi:hypothetical protein
MQNQLSTRITTGLAATRCGKMALTKNPDVNVTFGGSAWITGKLRGDQKMIIGFGELIIFLGPVGLSALGGSHYCSRLIVGQNYESSVVKK